MEEPKTDATELDQGNGGALREAPSAPKATPDHAGRPNRVAFFTLGCKVNQQETAALQELFRERGYEIVSFDSLAEVYIINTCSVTHMADHKSRQMIRRAARRHPEAVIAAIGCYAQLAPEEALSLGVDVLVGTRCRGRIVDLVEQIRDSKRAPARGEGAVRSSKTPNLEPRESHPTSDSGAASSAAIPGGAPDMARHRPGAALCIVSPLSEAAGFEVLPLPRPHNRARAFLKIEDGCDQYCSYCIVPFARGPVRSLQPELALQQLGELLAAGYREVVLTGVHTSAYGRDLPGGVNLASLLRLLLRLPGEYRLRLSSVEPAEVTGELLEAMASPRICRHLHLPLQSGDDEILALMGRPYTAGDYRDLFRLVQQRLPGVAVTADVMVGFPGETDLRFENTCRFIAGLTFRDLHVFQYSPRPGTRAVDMPGQVAPAVKEERSARLRRLADEQAAAFAGRFLGETLPVLVERRSRRPPGARPDARHAANASSLDQELAPDGELNAISPCIPGRAWWEGLSDNYLRIVFPAPAGSADLQGRLVPVRVLKRLKGDTLYGEAV